MEVSDQTIDHFKLITRIDENLGITCPGCQFTVMCLCCTFDCTGGSRAYRNDFITAGFGLAPFEMFHLDLAGIYAGNDEFGGVLQTSFTF